MSYRGFPLIIGKIPEPPLHPVIVVAVGKIVKASPIRLSSGKRAMETAIAFQVINEDDREEIVAYSFKR